MPKVLYCWRCRMDIPMLDDREWERVGRLLTGRETVPEEIRREHNAPLSGVALARLYQPALDEYFRLTGLRETNHLALYHHRASLYGPPCRRCGKPLRTPGAARCVACGAPAPAAASGARA